MLKTFFFVPANNIKFIRKAPSIPATYFVYDLEDSISKKEKNIAFENLKNIEITENTYVRPNLYNENETINSELFLQLIKVGFRNFLIPKVMNLSLVQELNKIFKITDNSFYNFKFILLIEHPAGLINLTEIIRSKLLNIEYVGLGNYDYSNIMGMKHTLENLRYARNTILNIAKAHELEAIDIVSLNLDDEDGFCNEVLNGFSMGFDAKFIIHPNQIELINNIQFYSQEEINEAKTVYQYILDIENDTISIKKINGKIYEKPHIKRIKKIINWTKRYEGK